VVVGLRGRGVIDEFRDAERRGGKFERLALTFLASSFVKKKMRVVRNYYL